MRQNRLVACIVVGLSLAQACTSSRLPPAPSPRPGAPFQSEAPSKTGSPPLLHLMSEPGKYEVQLPISEGMLDYSQTNEILSRSIECHVTFTRLDYAYGVVEYCDLPFETIADLAPGDLLARALDDLLRPFKVRVASQQSSLADEAFPSLTLSGRVDMRGLGDDGDFEARIVLAERRVYFVMMAASDSDQCRCITMKSQVVNSFHVVPDLSIPFEPTP